MYKKMGETYQLAMWDIGRQCPIHILSLRLAIIPWKTYAFWMHGGQRLVYLLNNLGR